MDIDMKHVFVFNTSKGTMTVGTDYLTELAEQEWFRKFIGYPANNGDDSQKSVDPQQYEKDVVQAAQQMAEEMAKEQERINAEYAQQEQQRQQAQAQAQQQFQNPPQPPRSSSSMDIRKEIPAQREQSFMDVTPDRMTDEIWGGLNEEQRKQYAAKYMGRK